ncbi:MAG: DNA repair protein RecN (Recombination protein N) [bacterium]
MLENLLTNKTTRFIHLLTHLHIRNVGLIEHCQVDFLPGFTIITGETGAGKSMLIDALSLGLGARADSSLIRHGAESAVVEVCFKLDINHPVIKSLDDYGLELDDGELVLRRMLTADKSRAFVNGSKVTQAQLKLIAERLVDIHGQYDHQLILKPAKHADMLDKFGRLSNERTAVSNHYNGWLHASSELNKARELLKSRADEEILLNAYIEELQAFNPEEGEEERLTQERKRLMSGEKVSESMNAALNALSGDVDITGALGYAETALASVGDVSKPLSELYERLANVAHEVTELVIDIERAGSDMDADPARLLEVDDRLFALKDCARKHQTTVDNLPNTLELFIERREKLDHLQEDMSALEVSEKETRLIFEKSCAVLSTSRIKASKNLSIEVEKSLKHLEMPHTKFEATLFDKEPDHWDASGAEKIEFMVATNAGNPMAPLVKIASGGEVSRLMLALKQVFYKNMSETTLIFDEIDTGVGGSVAEAMGLAMKDLSSKHQVFSITHLAQVAAKGHRHVKISKNTVDNKTITDLLELDDKSRLVEVSRMLSGKDITKEAEAAAAKLLDL